MLYLFYGSDREKARTRVRALVKSLLDREPDAGYFRFDAETFTKDTVPQYTQSIGLFSKRYIVVYDRVCDGEEKKDTLLASLRDFKESPNIFILLEGHIPASDLRKIEKLADKVQVCDSSVTRERPRPAFNMFSLTDALGKRDKKALWVLYQRALRESAAPEEIHGTLHWQIKTLLLVSRGDISGLKPFVISKARGFCKNFREDELAAMLTQLVRMYHEARGGGVDLSLALERFILKC